MLGEVSDARRNSMLNPYIFIHGLSFLPFLLFNAPEPSATPFWLEIKKAGAGEDMEHLLTHLSM